MSLSLWLLAGVFLAAQEEPDPCATVVSAEPQPAVARRVDEILKSQHLEGASVGIYAVAYPEGILLYSRNADARFNPASVSKIFTAAVALLRLGGETRFTTALYHEGGDCGALWLKGGGDPGLDPDDVRGLAHAVRKKGIRCVASVSYDASIFDGPTLPPCFEQKESDENWRPRVGAVAMADAAISLIVRPGDYAGAIPKVEVVPETSCVLVADRALTVDGKPEKELEADVERQEEKLVIHLSGEIPLSSTNGIILKKAVLDPDRFTACYLVDQLKRAGVKVRREAPSAGKVPEGLAPLFSAEGDPLAVDVTRMQTWSRNFVAEQILKLLSPGRCSPASFKCGLRVMRRTLPRFHLEPGCFKVKNASGLYKANLFTPAQVVRFLVEVANRGDIGKTFVDSFAVSGRTGTLKDRLRRMDRKVRAKTGTLDDVSSLAGYIWRSEGRYIAFAILFNRATASAESLRRIQDQIVIAFATWAEGKLR